MKKLGLLLCGLFILPLGVFAASNPKVTEINTKVDENVISYTGKTEKGSHAVMCKLYNSKGEEVALLSTAVDNTNFKGEFNAPNPDTYTVACANYEGGELKTVEVTVEEKDEEESGNKEFTLENDESIITFTEEKTRKFIFVTNDLLNIPEDSMTAEEKKELDEIIEKVKKAVAKQGDLIGAYEFIVVDAEDNDVRLHEGPFKIKIKLTEEMKKYNSFALIFVDDNFEMEDPITLTIEGDYLVGTLKHLSGYALVGNKDVKNNPKTGDNYIILIGMMSISIIGLGVGALYFKKKSVKNN